MDSTIPNWFALSLSLSLSLSLQLFYLLQSSSHFMCVCVCACYLAHVCLRVCVFVWTQWRPITLSLLRAGKRETVSERVREWESKRERERERERERGREGWGDRVRNGLDTWGEDLWHDNGNANIIISLLSLLSILYFAHNSTSYSKQT